MEGDAQIEFGRNLRALRLERGLSQETLADQLDLHRTFIGSVERGERNLTFRTAERLSDALAVDLITMLGGTRTTPGLRAAATGVDPGARRRAPRRRPGRG